VNTKQKGNNFERDCSRRLSLWWTNGKRDDAIWRSASSGALTTVGNGRYLAHTGDFAATDGEAELLFKHVIIEAKRGYNRYSVQDLLDVPQAALTKSPTYDMFHKLSAACSVQLKYGMLLWKRDRRELLVFFRDRLYPLGIPPIVPENAIWINVLCPDGVWMSGVPWSRFKSTVSADRLRSLLAPPVALSESTPSTPS